MTANLRPSAVPWALMLALCAGCAPPAKPSELRVPVPTTDHRSVPVHAPADPRKPVAHVLPGSVGPHLAATGSGWMVTWASPTEKGYQVRTAAIDAQGIAAAEHEVVHLESRISDLVVSSQAKRHVLALFLGSDSKSSRLDAVELGEQGELLGPPRLVRSAPSPIVWAEAPPISDSLGRSVIFWAERAGAGVDLYQAVQRDGQSGAPVQLGRDVVAWQVVTLEGRIALATLGAGVKGKSVIALRMLDASTQTSPQPLTVATLDRGGLDLDMVSSNGQLVLGWSEGAPGASRLMVAAVDLASERVQLSPATAPRGEQTLLRLVAEGSEVHAMWQELGHATASQRAIWYGQLAQPWTAPFALSVGGHLIIDGADSVLPMFGATASAGPFVLAHGQPVADAQGSNTQAPSQSAGYFLAQPAASGRWSARRIEDLVDHEPLVQVWDLVCRSDQPAPTCAGLAADGGSPTNVYLFDATTDVTKYAAPQISLGDGVAHMVSRQVVASIPELSALSAVTVADRKLVSWLSYFDPNVPYTTPAKPAPDGKLQPVRSLLGTWSFRDAPDDFALPVDSASISLRARSWGGVDLASAGDKALLGWAAVDQGDPQVFATLLDARGQKLQQKMLTKTSGEVFDVSAAHGPSGYLLSFIDTTTGNDEVYVMRVDERLNASAPLKVTDGALHPTGLVSQMVADQLVLAWAENRDADPAEGASIYMAVVDGRAEKLLVLDHVVLDQGAYLHSPQLGLYTDHGAPHLFLAYLVDQNAPDEGQEDLSVGDTRLRYVSSKVGDRLSDNTFEGVASQELPVAHVGAFHLDCAKSCRFAVVAKGPWSAELWLAQLQGQVATASPISPVYVPTPQLATPILSDDEVYFAEAVAQSDQFQLMRLRVQWHE